METNETILVTLLFLDVLLCKSGTYIFCPMLGARQKFYVMGQKVRILHL